MDVISMVGEEPSFVATDLEVVSIAETDQGGLSGVGPYYLVVAVTPDDALALARASDLIASVPERHTGALRAGLHSFPLPVALPQITISMLWHPRLDADPAHRWLRECLREVCAADLSSRRSRRDSQG